MTRIARSMREAEVHHVVNRGCRRQEIFGDDQDRAGFIGILGDALIKYRARCVALCLMGNHFHLIIRSDTRALGKVMHDLGSRYTVRFNSKYGFDGSLFKGRYFSSPISDAEYLRNCIRYVNKNPVDIRPPVDVDGYRWSTQRHYLGRSPEAPWMDVAHGLAAFSNNRIQYQTFFASESSRPSLGAVIRWFDDANQALPVRALAVLVAGYAGWTDEELREQAGVSAVSSVRSLRRRAKERVKVDEEVAALVEECRAALQISPPIVLPRWFEA